MVVRSVEALDRPEQGTVEFNIGEDHLRATPTSIAGRLGRATEFGCKTLADPAWIHIGESSQPTEGKIIMNSPPKNVYPVVKVLKPLLDEGLIQNMKFAHNPELHGYATSVICLYCDEADKARVGKRLKELMEPYLGGKVEGNGENDFWSYKTNQHTLDEATLFDWCGRINSPSASTWGIQRDDLPGEGSQESFLATLRSDSFRQSTSLTGHQLVVLDNMLAQPPNLPEPERAIVNQFYLRSALRGTLSSIGTLMNMSLRMPINGEQEDELI